MLNIDTRILDFLIHNTHTHTETEKKIKTLMKKLHLKGLDGDSNNKRDLDKNKRDLTKVAKDTRKILSGVLDDQSNDKWKKLEKKISDLYTTNNKTREGGNIAELLMVLLLLTKSGTVDSINVDNVNEIFWQGFSKFNKGGICERVGIAGGEKDVGIDLVVEMTSKNGEKEWVLIQVKFRKVSA